VTITYVALSASSSTITSRLPVEYPLLFMVRDRSLSPTALYHAVPHSPNVDDTTLPPTLASDSHVLLDDEPSDEPVGPASAEIVNAQIRWIHFVLGCAVLLPWNGAYSLFSLSKAHFLTSCFAALITAVPYFLSRVEGSPLRATFSSYLSFSFTGPSLIFVAHAAATSKQVRQLALLCYWP
jgi:solute carrier family 29 (equilibrative nucleoside transporter), member 1/2/3